jgi:Concanavalin A-like lectin/glucanases superfamily/Chitobiase/beta-hexosaminidase C-terminal domain
MTPAANAARLTELCNAINLAIIPECARWNYRTPANWASSRDNILNAWFPARTNTVLGYYQTAGFYPATAAPVFNLPPGTVASGAALTMTTTTGGSTMYFTTNGSDPRVGGEVVYNAPLVTAATVGKYRVPENAGDGFTVSNIPNLVAYYPFDANANDVAGGFNGTLTNGAAVTAPGRYGSGALTLNGTNQYVALGDPAGLKILGQITIAAWVKATNTTGLRNIVNKGHDNSTMPNGENTLRVNAGAYQGGYWAGAAGTVVASGPATGVNSAAADLNVWTHVASVWDGATWRLYRNGVQISSAASAVGAVTVPNVGWAIGARGTGSERFFAGQIDEVRIYNRGLSAGEITAIYNNTATTPVATWAAPGRTTAHGPRRAAASDSRLSATNWRRESRTTSAPRCSA